MSKIAELYTYMNGKIPASLRLAWDNDGLMCCADASREVKRVMVCLDVTESVVALAEEQGIDVIVSHHPMIFKGVKSVSGDSGVSRKIIRCLQKGITVMSFHTRLDAVEGGVNDVLAALLDIRETLPFGEGEETIGRIGHLDEPMEAAAFAALVKERIGADSVLLSDAGKPVYRVAVLGGEGGDFIGAAVAAGADTYVSGSLGYHPMVDAPEMGINLIEAGHFFTEHPVCERLADWIRAYDPKVEIVMLNSNRLKRI